MEGGSCPLARTGPILIQAMEQMVVRKWSGRRGRHFRRTIVISSPSSQLRMSRSDRQTFQQNDDHDDLLIRPPLSPLLGRRHAAVRHSQNRDSKEVDDDDGSEGGRGSTP